MDLMKNKYGNYVIIKSLSCADPEDKLVLMQAIQKCTNSINVSKYRTRWLQFLDENNKATQPGKSLKPSLFKTSDSSNSSRKQSYGSDFDYPDDRVESPTYIKKEDKNSGYSQFYYQNNSKNYTNNPNSNNAGYKEKTNGGYYEKGGKGGKSSHQKFYVEKNSKGGYSHY